MIMTPFHTTTMVPLSNVTADPGKWTNEEIICVVGLSVLSFLILILFGAFAIMTYCRVRKGESLHKILCE